jgi:hypothetical protein
MAVTLHGAAHTHAQTGAAITVTPAAGSQDDIFTFNGVGFGAGEMIDETYTDPSGQQYTFYTQSGDATVIVAGDDGSWQVTVHPATDFTGAYAGTWLVSFCTEDTAQCFSGTIDISL